MCAGLKHDAFNGKLWVLRNPGANPALTLIDAGMFTQQDFTYAASPFDTGGYDDAAFVNGQAFLSASNPTLQSGQNNFPSIVSTQVTVEDTVFATQASGTIYVVDTTANTVYAVAGNRFSPNSASFVTSDDTRGPRNGRSANRSSNPGSNWDSSTLAELCL